MAEAGEGVAKGGALVRRHRLPTRVWHWVNAAALIIMLMSGLMIFNAHPRLYWGEYGANYDHAWLEIDGEVAFPGWVTIPSHYSLADARLWHMAFAWVLAAGLAGSLHLILKMVAIHDVEHPSYVVVLGFTEALWIIFVYKLLGRREHANVAAGLGIVGAAAGLVLLKSL